MKLQATIDQQVGAEELRELQASIAHKVGMGKLQELQASIEQVGVQALQKLQVDQSVQTEALPVLALRRGGETTVTGGVSLACACRRQRLPRQQEHVRGLGEVGRRTGGWEAF